MLWHVGTSSSWFNVHFTFCMWFSSDIVVNTAGKSWHQSDLYQRVFTTVSTPAVRQEHERVNSFLPHSFFPRHHTIGGAFPHFGGHTSRSGERQSDEHIIRRTSPLTMPIYFDNQLTIVPVRPLKGQWFIRIDQFWVTSCARFVRANRGVTGGAVRHVIKCPGLINSSSTCRIKQSG